MKWIHPIHFKMKNFVSKKFLRPVCFIFGLALILLNIALLKADVSPDENTFYDSNPAHLWNRLNKTLFIRIDREGKKYGLDELDILYWFRTKNLLVEPSHQQALTILDEFNDTHGEKLIRDPLKRALLQRDLWSLFDWVATPFGNVNESGARRELQSRLAIAIRRVALSTNEIALLPDNYAESKTLPDLPQGLFKTNGAWVNVGIGYSEAAAMAHVANSSGRSTFLVMLRHPGGRPAAIDYLKQLSSFTPMWVYRTNSDSTIEPQPNPALPQFPRNTQWALVRRMNVIDTEGRIQPTRIVESIQMRTYQDFFRQHGEDPSLPENPKRAQRFQEFQMSRTSNPTLNEIEKGEKSFRQFFSKGFDPFEHQSKGGPSEFQMEPLRSCIECHSDSGIHSVNTFSRRFSGGSSVYTPQIIASNPKQESAVTINWKQTQFNWGLLQGLWRHGE